MRTLTSGNLAALACLVALAPACDAGDRDVLQCPDDPGPFTIDDQRVTGTLSIEPPEEPLGRDDTLVVRGTALHADGLAIREVLVGGVSAERTKFNFKQWAATLSYQDLVLASEPNADGEVTVQVSAIDACGLQIPFAELQVPVDLTPNTDFETLELRVAYAQDRGFIPADGSASAVLTVTATGALYGARVQFDAPQGSFPSLPPSRMVRLEPEGFNPDAYYAGAAYATTVSGPQLVTVSGDGVVASVIVVAAGPPEVIPAAAQLVPGSSLTVLVASDGDVASCRTTDAPGFEVLNGGTVIGAAPMPVEADADGDVFLDVTALEDAERNATLTILCEDSYRQLGAATYTLTVD